MIASNLKPEAEQVLVDLLMYGGARSTAIAQRAIDNFRAEAAAGKDAEIDRLRADRASIEGSTVRRALEDVADHWQIQNEIDTEGEYKLDPGWMLAELRRMAHEGRTYSAAAVASPNPEQGEAYPPVEDFSIETFDADMWMPVTFKRKTLTDAQERCDSYRRRFPDQAFRIVRWSETSTVVADLEATR